MRLKALRPNACADGSERQIKDFRQIVTQHDERADRERAIPSKQLEQVELAGALQARVDKRTRNSSVKAVHRN